MRKILALAIILVFGVMTRSNANVVTINNLTSWQYNVILYDIMGGTVTTVSVGAGFSGSQDFGSVNVASGKIIIGLSGGVPTADDMVHVGHPTSGYPTFQTSVNTYPWFGDGPFAGYWNQPGATATGDVILNIM